MEKKPPLIVREEGELCLSGDSLTQLLRAVMEKGKPFRFRAKGWSMAPFVRDGDVVTVTPLDGRRLKTGEIAAFLHPSTGKIAVHRIIHRKSGYVSLKGDNAFVVDGRLPSDRIFGSVSRIERYGKNIRLGLGPGRLAIAVLSRSGWLTPGLFAARRILRRGSKGT